MDPVFGLSFGIEGIKNEKESKLAIFQKFFWKKQWAEFFFETSFRRKYSLRSCAVFSENMVSVSVLGFEKIASQVWKIGTCHEICDKKNVTIWASRRARAPKKRHHMGISQSSCPEPRREGMSRLASSRNVQWSAEGATNCVYPRVQTQVDLYSLRSGNCDERKMKEYIFFEKNEIRMFGKKRRRHTWWRKLW